ncbi:hypothetical protein EUBDOL_00248 [Amedibacillus dolichus DSM 3991]|uniref:Uncharacterized protein n=1 Tax=Amedibacillus dolichus DSM 3991 TaxID=428127 RepID=A8R8B3_9FIRM|nr:hypothetical protein EUBDOL_00248 [Amedibacillus dolichus DSM 3991]
MKKEKQILALLLFGYKQGYRLKLKSEYLWLISI